MTDTGRRPGTALLAVVATCAVLTSGVLLPAFGAAAPANEVATELTDLGGEIDSQSPATRSNPDAARESADAGVRAGAGGGAAIRLGSIRLSLPRSGLLTADGHGQQVGGGPTALFARFASLLGGPGVAGPTTGQQGQVSGGAEIGGSFGGAGGGGGFALAGGAVGSGDAAAGNECPRGENGYAVCFEERLVPGTNTTVTVYTADGPASDVHVFFNGELVGYTDETGEVTGRVPYVRELEVLVQGGGGAASLRDGHRYALATAARDTANASVVTDLNVTVDGAAPGADAVARVTLSERPVPDAVVRVDGDRVGTTDERGRLVLSLPVAEVTTVSATRGELSVSERIRLAAIDATIRGRLPFGVAVPGQSATVVVTDDGTPVEAATVSFAETTIGETGPNGTVATTLPMRPTLDLSVETATGLVVHTSERLWVPLGAALAVLLGLVGGAGFTYRRSSASGRGFLDQVRLLLGQFAGYSLSALVSVAVGFEATVDRLRERTAALFAAVRDLDFPSAADIAGRLLAILRARWMRTMSRTNEHLKRLTAPLSGDDGENAGVETNATASSPRDRIVRVWRRLLATLSLRRVQTMTPGQVAERAIVAGLPRGPVEQLVDAFRTVEYSSADPERHAETAERVGAELMDHEEGAGDA